MSVQKLASAAPRGGSGGTPNLWSRSADRARGRRRDSGRCILSLCRFDYICRHPQRAGFVPFRVLLVHPPPPLFAHKGGNLTTGVALFERRHAAPLARPAPPPPREERSHDHTVAPVHSFLTATEAGATACPVHAGVASSASIGNRADCISSK